MLIQGPLLPGDLRPGPESNPKILSVNQLAQEMLKMRREEEWVPILCNTCTWPWSGWKEKLRLTWQHKLTENAVGTFTKPVSVSSGSVGSAVSLLTVQGVEEKAKSREREAVAELRGRGALGRVGQVQGWTLAFGGNPEDHGGNMRVCFWTPVILLVNWGLHGAPSGQDLKMDAKFGILWALESGGWRMFL